ncbi:hypothetical protein QZL74_36620 (plasmid) [Burkholderia gladioli pv. alliicola]|uniref:Uncharacterized protein n=1 Tax=Burkholderia gladioli TaxID=28095 RepID=A0A2A7SAE0_BURGA|nr:hypothetical protein [Burkholderia gladioli]PEH40531.1 hypothetical protein CRM94_16090 [Burkholderia gladioli]
MPISLSYAQITAQALNAVLSQRDAAAHLGRDTLAPRQDGAGRGNRTVKTALGGTMRGGGDILIT